MGLYNKSDKMGQGQFEGCRVVHPRYGEIECRKARYHTGLHKSWANNSLDRDHSVMEWGDNPRGLSSVDVGRRRAAHNQDPPKTRGDQESGEPAGKGPLVGGRSGIAEASRTAQEGEPGGGA